MGDTSRNHTKKNPDTWTGTSKQKSLAKEKQLAKCGERDAGFEVISFLDFIKAYRLDEDYPHSVINQELLTSRWNNVKPKMFKPPGSGRTLNALAGYTLCRSDPATGKCDMIKGLYDQFMYPIDPNSVCSGGICWYGS